MGLYLGGIRGVFQSLMPRCQLDWAMRAKLFLHYALYRGLGNIYKRYRQGKDRYPYFFYIEYLQASYYIECKLEARRTVQINQNITSKANQIQVHRNALCSFLTCIIDRVSTQKNSKSPWRPKPCTKTLKRQNHIRQCTLPLRSPQTQASIKPHRPTSPTY